MHNDPAKEGEPRPAANGMPPGLPRRCGLVAVNQSRSRETHARDAGLGRRPFNGYQTYQQRL